MTHSVILNLQSDFGTIGETYVETSEVDIETLFTLRNLEDATGKRDTGTITGNVEVVKRRGVGVGGDEGNNSSESVVGVDLDFSMVSTSHVTRTGTRERTRARTEGEWLPSFNSIETTTKLTFNVVLEPTGLLENAQ